ncbi:hypothetical protein Bca101_088357 [Brassica carinata]
MGPVRRDIVIPKRCTRWEALRTTPHHVQVQGLDVDDLTLVDIDVGGLHSTSLTGKGEILKSVLKLGGRLGKREHGRLGLGDNDKISKIVPQRVNLLPDKDILHVIGRGDHGRRLWKECNTWTAIGVVFIFHHLKEALITPERSKENGQLLVVGSTVLPSWNVCLIIFDPPVT